MRLHPILPLAAAALAAVGCSSKSKSNATCVQTGCSSGLVCESVAGGSSACFDPVWVTGYIYDLASSAKLADARVVGQDVNGAPVSSVAISAADGTYEFTVAATRNADGSVATGTVTLRVDRAGYATFPSGLRTALPIALTTATHANNRWTVSSSLTNVGLEALASAPAGEITGTVALPAKTGALVVAECGSTAYTAVPGTDGTYAIFNVPDGSCSVTAYATGVNYTPVQVTVASNTVTANLVQSSTPTATVSGSVQFVSQTDWSTTSVLLVVASTYDSNLVRGISPPGLAARQVSSSNGGPWSISGVPDGHYRVLAAFETDYLVRDPSDIGGTAVLEFWVQNGLVYLADPAKTTTSPVTSLQGFKITGAVRLMEPISDGTGACTALTSLPADPGTLPVGGCTTTSTTPTIAWEMYSGTKSYDLTVIDETGTVIVGTGGSSYGTWTVGQSSGTITAAVPAALSPGTYQVRVVAWPVTGTKPISTSEDLLGVFTVQ